jgi:hypothetical protein
MGGGGGLWSALTGRGYEETRHAELPVRKGVKVGLKMWSSGRIDESLSAPSTASLEKSSCPFSAPRSNYRTAASPVEAVAMPTRHTRTVTVEIGKHRPIYCRAERPSWPQLCRKATILLRRFLGLADARDLAVDVHETTLSANLPD